jgi:hypothetical protein
MIAAARSPAGRASLTRAAWAALPLVAIASLGLVTSRHPAHVREALPSLLIAVAAALGWSLAIDASTLRRLLDLQIVPAVVMAVVGVLQFHHLWQPFALDPEMTRIDPRLGVTSLAGNVADFAAALVLPLLIAQARIWERASRPGRGAGERGRGALALWGGAAALGLYAVALSATLTAMAALVLSTLALWLVLVVRKARFAIALAAVVAVGSIAIVAGPLRPRASRSSINSGAAT